MDNYNSENTNYNDIRQKIDRQIEIIENSNNNKNNITRSFYKRLISKVMNKL